MAEILQTDEEAIKKCVHALSSGEVIVYPTDTLYGIGADATIESCVAKVFIAKKRPIEGVVSVAVSSVEAARSIAKFTPLAERVAKTLLPGPLTLVLEARQGTNLPLRDGKIGIRVPDNSFTIALIEKFGKPIVSTSANLHGGKSPVDFSEIPTELLETVSVAVDGGRTKYAASSTVVDLSTEEIKVIREGAIKAAELEEIAKNRSEEK